MAQAKATRGSDFDQQALRRRLILLLTGMIACAVIAVGIAANAAFERAVAPELQKRVQLITSVIQFEVQRALEVGIPIDAIGGLDAYLADTLQDFGEIDRIAVNDADGRLVADAERPERETRAMDAAIKLIARGGGNLFELPILRGNQIAGKIVVEISPTFVETRLRDVFLDIGVLVLIAVLIAIELILAVVVASVVKPLERIEHLLNEQRTGVFLHIIRQTGLLGLRRTASRLNDHAVDLATRFHRLPDAARRAVSGTFAGAAGPVRLRFSDFNDIRLALFLFSAATEVSVSFLPIYAGAATRPDWLTPNLAAALPIVFYLAAIAVLSPFGGALVRAFGARRLYAFSVPGAALALVGVGASDGVLAITVWHCVMAGFYAAATIAGQEYAIRAAGPARSGAAVGSFVAVIYGGLLFGSVLGGLLAGRFGFPAAFFVGAAMAAVSQVMGLTSMSGRAGDRDIGEAAAPKSEERKKRWFSLRYLVLLAGIALPMSAAMVIYIWYLTPLMLSDLGVGPAEIVRVLLLYYAAILFLGPQIARMSDGRPGPVPLILAGGLFSGLALLAPAAIGGYWSIVLAVAGVGLGEVLMRTPLYTHALRQTGGPGPGIDALRLTERLGAIAALLISVALLGALGPAGSLRLLAGFMLAGVVAFAIVEFTARHRRG